MNDELKPLPMGRIRIVETPYGDAPEDIRRQWVGVEMPCIWFEPNAESAGTFSGEYKSAEDAFRVFQKHAIDALEQVNPDAARWWRIRGYPRYETAVWLFDAKAVLALEVPKTRGEITGEAN